MKGYGVCACGGELVLMRPSNMLSCGDPACEPRWLLPPFQEAS